MSIVMPAPDSATITKRDWIIAAMRKIVPGEGVIVDADALRPYESDGLTAYRQPPMLVVLPDTVSQVSAVLRWCQAEGVKAPPPVRADRAPADQPHYDRSSSCEKLSRGGHGEQD